MKDFDNFHFFVVKNFKKQKIEYYEKISKHFKKRKDIEIYASKNQSFDIFVKELNDKIN